MGIKKYMLTAVMIVCAAISAFAYEYKTDSLTKTEIRYVKETESWLSLTNPAGLATTDIHSLFEVNLYATKNNGGWINYFQSSDSHKYGASAESFLRYSPRLVLYGKIDYNNFTGKNMNGSCLIEPGLSPFDIVEHSDSNSGTKNKEDYHLYGIVGYKISPRISIGAEISYAVASYAKQKDLRHTNDLLDLQIGTGLIYKPAESFLIGANYAYRRRVEGLTFANYGQGDQVFQSLVSYGAFFGSLETFGENGYTSKNEHIPLTDEYHCCSVQAGVNIGEDIQIINEVGYKKRNGQYGTKSPSDVVYSTHDASVVSYKGIVSIDRGNKRHRIKFTYDNDWLNNKENIYQYTNETGGRYDVVYYGSTDVGKRNIRNTSLEYTGFFEDNCHNALWVIKTGWNIFNRKQTASRHPYYRLQDVHNHSFNLSGEHNIIKGNDSFLFSLGGVYRFGGDTCCSDGIYATPSTQQPAPQTNDALLHREYEYLTAKQMRGNTLFRYGRLVNDRKTMLYASVEYEISHAMHIYYLGSRNHNELTVKMGCLF